MADSNKEAVTIHAKTFATKQMHLRCYTSWTCRVWSAECAERGDEAKINWKVFT